VNSAKFHIFPYKRSYTCPVIFCKKPYKDDTCKLQDSLHSPPVLTTPAENFANASKKVVKTFLNVDVFHLPPELRISPRIFEKFEMALLEYSGTWEKLIHEKNLKLKISWQSSQDTRRERLSATHML